MIRIVGTKRIDYTKKDGTEVKGYEIYCEQDNVDELSGVILDENIEGIIASSCYMNDATYNAVKIQCKNAGFNSVIGSQFKDFRYNSRGRVVGFF